uniref:Replication protein A 70 kDa DNA-binding subunit B/D first OB fold domain-containing protein n=1 Tax=Brassica campestris TaxID=3711 RepID=M4DDF3_BRACM
MAPKPNGKCPITSESDDNVMFFRDVSPGPHETQLRFRLIHFWEAWNPLKKTLIGIEMLLIDEQGTVIQGFISPGRIERYLPKMKPGSVYKLNNFYGSSNKSVYRVSDHAVTASFSWNSELSVLEDSPIHFDEDRFRFHSFEDFQASCDRKGDLYVPPLLMKTDSDFIPLRIFKLTAIAKETSTITYFVLFLLTHLMNKGIDVVGHMKLVNGQSLIGTPVLDEVEIERARHLLVHVQSQEYSCPDFNVLLTCFMDYDVQPTIDYFGWLGSNPQSAEEVNVEVVTKRETLTIGEIFSYIKQGSTKEAFFECTATIDDVVYGSTWYRAHISVYDNSEQAVFVLLGDAGFELTGKHASELVSNYFEVTFIIQYSQYWLMETKELPKRCLSWKLYSAPSARNITFVLVTKHNLDGKSRSLTVTKILPLDTPPVTEASEGNNNTATSEETSETGNTVCEASKHSVDSAEGSKRTNDIDEMGKAKRLKCGK